MDDVDATPPPPASVCEAFQRTAAVDPAAIALRTVAGTRTVTWRELADDVRVLAAGLAALGIRHGDTVALMMANRTEFYPLDLAVQHLGATPFSVYNTLAPAQLAHVLRNSASRMVVCEAKYLDTVLSCGTPVECVVVLDDDEAAANAGALTLEHIRQQGLADDRFDFEATWRAVQPDDVLTLIYTSGTTGTPKGVEITHANLLAQGAGVAQVLDFRFGDRITSYLPSAHIADRFTGLYALALFGVQVTVVPDIKRIAEALLDCRPTIWVAVPRIWNKLKQALEHTVAEERDEQRRKVVEQAIATGARRSRLTQAGEPVGAELAAAYADADSAVLSGLRERLGLDHVRWAASGAAPTPPATLEFFASLGIAICEGWGMSELSCFVAVSAPAQARFGTVGTLLPGLEGRRADDGEFLVRGPSLMKGYRADPDRTREAVDADGWFHTGDVVVADADGYLTIVDRKKDLIINEAGKNISPVSVETALTTASALIGTAVAIGDNRPYITALLVLDAQAAAAFAAAHALDPDPKALVQSAPLIDALAAAVAVGNGQLSRVEQVKRFRVVPAYWEGDGDELTATMKLKRRKVAEKYAADIAALYADPLADDVRQPVDRPREPQTH
ncbi:Long-chain acyl-CoA synthetase (AMP-forming) [Streptomyces sp. yr375]|uniref:AMP-binding protein n=1 Tax=Streptomyces sp. yr375 TaxID=1761906 RepID=UPI0008C8313E|nr:AMP-binding protein [Streptomyces sp. yr375]SER12210.1 Long-chain acyl-CoA synthetase (AMP-forming) [Streptomyces sp. yr375]